MGVTLTHTSCFVLNAQALEHNRYEIKFTLEDLISASKQNRETISPRSQHDDEGSGVASTEQQSYINAKFNVLGLIEFVKKKLILPDLLYA